MTIGERIRQRREELNMTQDDLAKKLGYISRSSINKIELGHNNLKQSKIVQIAHALDTTPAYIMGWTFQEHERILSEAEQRIIMYYRQLSEEDKIRIEERMKIMLEK